MKPTSYELCRAGLLLAAMLITTSLSGQAQDTGAGRVAVPSSLSLDQAIQIALRESRMVRAAQADVRAASAETRAVLSQTGPQVSANTYVSYGDSNNILFSTPNTMPINYLSVPAQGFADQNLTLMAPIYTGGVLKGQVRAARARESAAVFDREGTQVEVAQRVREAYYRALLGLDMERSAQARLDASSETVRTAQALFTAGKGLEASVRRAEADQADAQRMLTSTRNDRAKALIDLKVAMGVRLEDEVNLSDTLAFSPARDSLASQLAEAARLRPELQASRRRLSAAHSQTGAATGAQGPQIYGMAMADGFTGHLSKTREGYTVGLVVSLPLLDSGQRSAEIAKARAREERAEAEASDMSLRVEAEVRQAWLDIQTAAQNYRTAGAALQSAQAAYDVTALRVRSQKGLLVEQLDAMAALTQARTSLSQALYDHAAANARLRRAVGKI